MLRKIIVTSPTWALLPVRLALGAVFIGHGAQKVLGAWSGPGFKAFISNPAPYPFMRPAWLWMSAAALGELLAGAMVILGLFTRLGAFILVAIMVTAISSFHWGMFFLPKGMEYSVALLGMSLALLIAGGGQLSIDQKLMRSLR